MPSKPDDPFYRSKEFQGALAGVEAALGLYGIEMGEELCAQIATTCLIGFYNAGGFEPEGVDELQRVLINAFNKMNRGNDNG